MTEITNPYLSDHTGEEIDESVNETQALQRTIQAAVAPLATKTALAETNTALENEKTRAKGAEKTLDDKLKVVEGNVISTLSAFSTEQQQKIDEFQTSINEQIAEQDANIKQQIEEQNENVDNKLKETDEQLATLGSKITDKIPMDFVFDGFLSNQGALELRADFKATDYVSVEKGDIYEYTGAMGGSWPTMWAYGANHEGLRPLMEAGTHTNEKITITDEQIKYIRACAKVSISPVISLNKIQDKLDGVNAKLVEINNNIDLLEDGAVHEDIDFIDKFAILNTEANPGPIDKIENDDWRASKTIRVREGDVIVYTGFSKGTGASIIGDNGKDGRVTLLKDGDFIKRRVVIPSDICRVIIGGRKSNNDIPKETVASLYRVGSKDYDSSVECDNSANKTESVALNEGYAYRTASVNDSVTMEPIAGYVASSFVKVSGGDIAVYTGYKVGRVACVIGIDKDGIKRDLYSEYGYSVNVEIPIPSDIKFVAASSRSIDENGEKVNSNFVILRKYSNKEVTEEVNLLPDFMRCDAKTQIFDNESKGLANFRGALCFVSDDAVVVRTQNKTDEWCGIRTDKLPDFTGVDKVSVSFEIKSIYVDRPVNFSVLYDTGTYFVNNVKTTREFTKYEMIVKASDIKRIQISLQYGSTGEGFIVRNIKIVDTSVKVLSKLNSLYGKKIAIIGDSISSSPRNVNAYWEIKPIDVGNTISAYVMWDDVYTDSSGSTLTNKTIGDIRLTSDMIGTKVNFIPNSSDVGKTLGKASPYNSDQIITWGERLCNELGAKLIGNSAFSGSSLCSGQQHIDMFKNTFGWSEWTMGCLSIRDEEGVVIPPDVVFIYKGTNDMTHPMSNGKYASIKDYDIDNLGYPENDVFEDGTFSFVKAYYKTIQNIRSYYPFAKIYCCTLSPFKRINYSKFPVSNNDGSGSVENGTQYTIPQINDVIRKIADKAGCEIVEFDKCGITFENCYPTYIEDSSTTPTHPNNTGHQLLAEKAKSLFK